MKGVWRASGELALGVVGALAVAALIIAVTNLLVSLGWELW